MYSVDKAHCCRIDQAASIRSRSLHPSSIMGRMQKYIPNAFNLAVVIYVALGSTACSYGMAIIGSASTTSFAIRLGWY
jgi:hypothetical protein